MAKKVFILGAGASVDAGFPVMENFLDKAEDIKNGPDLSKDERGAFNRVFDIRHKLKATAYAAQINLDNIEDVFSAIEMGRILKKLADLDQSEIDQVHHDIEVLIGRTLDECFVLERVGTGDDIFYPSRDYNAFSEEIKNAIADNSEQISIITFNYDVALDYALIFNKIDFNYCLNEDDREDSLHLLKLHGSLNWGFCNKCNMIDHFNVHESIKPVRRRATTKIRAAQDIITKVHRCGQQLVGPFLVPPTFNKTYRQTGITNVWRMAARDLAEAREVYIIGYSFPSTDVFFHYLLALGTHSDTTIRKFVVANPDQSVDKRFKSILGPGIIKRYSPLNVYFSDAINSRLFFQPSTS